jgi:cell division protein FtsZ
MAAPEPAPARQAAEPAPVAAAATEPAAVRGRFDKSEPTIIDGEDLDVPTFMRKNLRMK